MYNLIDGSTTDIPANNFAAFADVRDVAEAHLLGYELDAAANQRFLIAGGRFSYQTSGDVIRQEFPDLRGRQPGTGAKEQFYRADGSKAERILGLKSTSLERTLKDTVGAFLSSMKRL